MSVATDISHRARLQGRGAPVWWLVFRRELVDLWTGGRVITLLILFSIVMSVSSVLRQVESQLSLIPPVEMVFLTILSSITFGLFVGLVIGADSVSGERERATLEPLLLTPAKPRQIVLGKFLAAMSPWPVTFLISIPYVLTLGNGDESIPKGLALGALLGGLLAVAFTGFGMLVSIWSRSNRGSLFASLLVYLIFLIPTQFPGSAQKGDLGYLIQQLNPLQASSEFLEKVLVNNRTVEERLPYLLAATYAAVGVLLVLFVYAAPRVRLHGGGPKLKLGTFGRSACLLVVAGAVATAVLAPAGPAFAATTADSRLKISIDRDTKILNAGDSLSFATVVTNGASEQSPALNVAMNIVKTGKGEGDPVDPEDWSPERTQSIEPLAPGTSTDLSWTVNAILEGDYMVYMTVIPEPSGPDSSSQPVASRGIHLTVGGFQESNPGGVLPVAIGTPLAMFLIALIPRSLRRRRDRDSEPATANGPATTGA